MSDVQWLTYPAAARTVALRCCGYTVALPVNDELRHGFAKRRDAADRVDAAPFVVKLTVAEIRHRCAACGTQWRLEPEPETDRD